MKTLLLTFIVLCYSLIGFSQTTELKLTTDIYHNNEELFHSHQGEGPWDSTLAMSIGYANIKSLQEARLSILGIGSAKGIVNGKEAETFFVIVDSAQLRNIRQQIFYAFTRAGGDRGSFDPTWFFPHITIGYIETDLHESNGVLKNLKHSLDKRFPFKTVP